MKMAPEPTIAVLNVALAARPRAEVRPYATVSDYWALTKPEVNFLILITTFAGFYLAPSVGVGGFRTMLEVHTLLGTLLVAGGTGTLNQFLEHSFDARMPEDRAAAIGLWKTRTFSRPLVRNFLVDGRRGVSRSRR